MVRRLTYAMTLSGLGLLCVLLVRLVLKLVDWLIDGHWVEFGLAFLIITVVLYVADLVSHGRVVS